MNYNVLIFILNLKDMKKQLLILPLILLLLYSCKTTKSSCDAYGSNNIKESKTTSK